MQVKDAFEIKSEHQTGHTPGLVVVLDHLVTKDLVSLVGQTAHVSTPGGKRLRLRIDDAKEHGSVSSLFFRNLALNDVPSGSEIEITREVTAVSA